MNNNGGLGGWLVGFQGTGLWAQDSRMEHADGVGSALASRKYSKCHFEILIYASTI